MNSLMPNEEKSAQPFLSTDEFIASQIATGFAQAEMGELIDEEDAIQMLLQRHEKRQFGWNTRDSWKKS